MSRDLRTQGEARKVVMLVSSDDANAWLNDAVASVFASDAKIMRNMRILLYQLDEDFRCNLSDFPIVYRSSWWS